MEYTERFRRINTVDSLGTEIQALLCSKAPNRASATDVRRLDSCKARDPEYESTPRECR